MEATNEFQVSHYSGRTASKSKTERYATADEARSAFVTAHLKFGDASYTAPTEKVTEVHHTHGGKVLVLLAADDGFWRIELWANREAGFYSTGIISVQSKAIATRQLMTIFSGVCAAERAA